MTLDDLLIYGDWLEENDINNTVYKLFLNCLRIKLRESMHYGVNFRFYIKNIKGNGRGYDKSYSVDKNCAGGDGAGAGYYNNYGGGFGNGRWFSYGFMDEEASGSGKGCGPGFGDEDGDGRSIYF